MINGYSNEKLNTYPESDWSTDVTTGDNNKRMYLYYQLLGGLRKAGSIDIIVSFLMESGVKMLLFQELDAVSKYDGILACSSILHLPKAEFLSVLAKMSRALKDNGVIYTSFKYGDFEGERNGRYFTDLTEESFGKLLAWLTDITVIESWITADVREGRESEKWLNLLLRKT